MPSFHIRNSRPHSFAIRAAAAWLILGAAALLCFANTFDNEFVYDDIPYILENDIVQGRLSAAAAFMHSYPPHQPHLGLYRPLPELMFAACWRFGAMGTDAGATTGWPTRAAAWPFHAANLLLHWIVCGLMFHLCLHIGKRYMTVLPASRPAIASERKIYFTALGASLFYAAHPARVECVAAMAGAVDLLAAALALGAILLGLSAVGDGKVSWRRLVASAACFLLALLSKENAAVTLPLLAILLWGVSASGDHGVSTAQRFRMMGAALLPQAAVLAVYLLIRAAVLGGVGIAPEHQYFKSDETALRFMSIPVVFLMNWKITLWPVELCADYNYPIRFLGDWAVAAPETWLNGWVLAGLAAMAGYGAALARLWRRHRAVALGLAWFEVALLPTSQLIPFGDLLGERFLYLPSIGLCFAIAAIAAENRLTLKHLPALLVGVAVVWGVLAVRTIARNEAWASPRAFWTALRRDAPANRVAPYGLAHAIAAERAAAITRGDAVSAAALEAEAIAAYEDAIRVTPDYLTAYLNLANLLFDARPPQPERARGLLADMIARAEAQPAVDMKASAQRDILYAGWARLGQHHADSKEWPAAREAFESAIAHRETPEALVLLGVARAETGDLAGAEAAWRRALALDPANAHTAANLRRLESRRHE